MNKTFSLILNSRGRPSQLYDLLVSIEQTTSSLSSIEVTICVDEDDLLTKEWIDNNRYEEFKFQIIFIIITPNTSNLHTNLNFAASVSSGKFIFGLNDDCLLLSQDWDKLSEEKLNNYLIDKPDGIVYGRTYDTSVDKGGSKEYASFPVLSKKAVEALGFYMDNRFVGWGGDVSCWRIFNEVGRICDLPDIQIDHLFHNELQKIFQPDATQQKMRQISNLHQIDCFKYDISQEVEKIKCKIQC